MSKIVFNQENLPAAIKRKASTDTLQVSEFFYDTVQGEGVNAGVPAVFLRFSKCVLNCRWCDTKETMETGYWLSPDELVNLFLNTGAATRLRDGAHLILTGGSPLLWQSKIVKFLELLEKELLFLPYIEVENECVIKPTPNFINYVSCWNNSPKLTNSGNIVRLSYQKPLLKFMSGLPNSWFKFVVRTRKDVEEIVVRYLEEGLMRRNQIILMPEGMRNADLVNIRKDVVEWAMLYGFRYSDRLQVLLWDDKKSV